MQIGYLISSHITYGPPLERLLDSMRDVAPADIFVAVGGLEDEPGWMHYRSALLTVVDHNSYDYTALITMLEDGWQVPDHLFLLHDTMAFGPETVRRIHEADPAHVATAVWGGQCNLMLLRTDYVRARARDILALKNCSKQAAIAAEGFLWREAPEDARGSYPGRFFERGTARPYGGAARIQEYYEGVDLVKWKANWGQAPQQPVVTP